MEKAFPCQNTSSLNLIKEFLEPGPGGLAVPGEGFLFVKDLLQPNVLSMTIAHELGHSHFGLLHCDEANAQHSSVTDDKLNFMHGDVETTSGFGSGNNLSNFNFRAYQWREILK